MYKHLKVACLISIILLAGCDNKNNYQALMSQANFMAFLTEQQTDPEKFGMRILQEQIKYVNAQENVRTLEQQLATLKADNKDAATMHQVEDKLAKAIKQRDDLDEEVRLMLAVVGLSSPN